MSEGLIGGVVGSLLTMFGNFVLHWLQTRNATKLDEVRKKLLHRMLGTRAVSYTHLDVYKRQELV